MPYAGDAAIPAATGTNYFNIRYGGEERLSGGGDRPNIQELEAITTAHRVTLDAAKATLNE